MYLNGPLGAPYAMLTHRWSFFAYRRWQLLMPLVGVVLLVGLLATGARATPPPKNNPAPTWPAAARPTADTAAQRWVAAVRADARLGAEPTGRCQRLDNRHAACPVAIVVLA